MNGKQVEQYRRNAAKLIEQAQALKKALQVQYDFVYENTKYYTDSQDNISYAIGKVSEAINTLELELSPDDYERLTPA